MDNFFSHSNFKKEMKHGEAVKQNIIHIYPIYFFLDLSNNPFMPHGHAEEMWQSGQRILDLPFQTNLRALAISWWAMGHGLHQKTTWGSLKGSGIFMSFPFCYRLADSNVLHSSFIIKFTTLLHFIPIYTLQFLVHVDPCPYWFVPKMSTIFEGCISAF